MYENALHSDLLLITLRSPLVLYSPTGQAASANWLQGLLAIPRFRHLITEHLNISSPPAGELMGERNQTLTIHSS